MEERPMLCEDRGRQQEVNNLPKGATSSEEAKEQDIRGQLIPGVSKLLALALEPELEVAPEDTSQHSVMSQTEIIRIQRERIKTLKANLNMQIVKRAAVLQQLMDIEVRANELISEYVISINFLRKAQTVLKSGTKKERREFLESISFLKTPKDIEREIKESNNEHS